MEEIGPPDNCRDMGVAHLVYQILATYLTSTAARVSYFTSRHPAQRWWLSNHLVIAVLSSV